MKCPKKVLGNRGTTAVKRGLACFNWTKGCWWTAEPGFQVDQPGAVGGVSPQPGAAGGVWGSRAWDSQSR